MPFDLPPVTRNLLIANVAVFLLQQVMGQLLMVYFALWPLGSGLFGVWQIVTSAFMHGSITHILFNMLALYMFGGAVERVFGERRYVLYYFVSVVSAAVTQLIVAALSGAVYPTIGASGGVFGLLLAYGMYFPHNRVMLLFPPIPLPARVFVTIYAVLELFLGVTGSQEGVAHFAHLGGMIGGYLLLRFWRASPRRPVR